MVGRIVLARRYALDVQYGSVPGEPAARVAAVGFAEWSDAEPAEEVVVELHRVEPYEPGRFYRRELPALLAVLAAVEAEPSLVVVDSHVWLDPARTRPGLGSHLHRGLGAVVPVIGVAKSPFTGSPALPLTRGGSDRPLHVDAVGLDPVDAAAALATMHGPFRVPTLLRRVDQLARGIVIPHPAA